MITYAEPNPVTSTEPTPLIKVLPQIIRRVMPNIITQSIIGVQPMAGPAGSIFNLHRRYGRRRGNQWQQKRGVRPSKQQFREFLRLNDRKRTQSFAELDAAGYPSVYMDFSSGISDLEVNAWLTQQIGPHRFLCYNITYWFVTADDAMLFKLRWL